MSVDRNRMTPSNRLKFDMMETYRTNNNPFVHARSSPNKKRWQLASGPEWQVIANASSLPEPKRLSTFNVELGLGMIPLNRQPELSPAHAWSLPSTFDEQEFKNWWQETRHALYVDINQDLLENLKEHLALVITDGENAMQWFRQTQRIPERYTMDWTVRIVHSLHVLLAVYLVSQTANDDNQLLKLLYKSYPSTCVAIEMITSDPIFLLANTWFVEDQLILFHKSPHESVNETMHDLKTAVLSSRRLTPMHIFTIILLIIMLTVLFVSTPQQVPPEMEWFTSTFMNGNNTTDINTDVIETNIDDLYNQLHGNGLAMNIQKDAYASVYNIISFITNHYRYDFNS